VKLCILCHGEGLADVTNGNALDMTTMVHKIHMGRSLPSVLGGTPYLLTQSDGTLDDHSDTWFPTAVQNCAMCHKGSQGQAAWQQHPTRIACGSCHDDVSFDTVAPAGQTKHKGGPQPDDSLCSSCHQPSNTIVAIIDRHAVASTAPNAPVLELAIANVESTAPGQTPKVHFSVKKNGVPLDILATPLDSLAVVLAGPTVDYASSEPTQYVIQGSAPEGVLATDGAAGAFVYTLPASVPLSATGTYAIGMEGHIVDSLDASRIYAAKNPVAYVAVTDATPVARRTVVDRAKCNSCHFDLSAHEGTRKSPEYCVLCHTPSTVNDLGVARFQVPSTTARSLDFGILTHKVHRGDALTQGYVLGTSPRPTPQNPQGTPRDFSLATYPGFLQACWACHASTSYLPPYQTGLLPRKTEQVLTCNDPSPLPAQYCASRSVASESFLPVMSALCTACHDAPSTVAHAAIMTAPNGVESCETCHGVGSQWDVQRVHAVPR
jgi:OmcA/MtrC family decaheme c-type cytochrome